MQIGKTWSGSECRLEEPGVGQNADWKKPRLGQNADWKNLEWVRMHRILPEVLPF